VRNDKGRQARGRRQRRREGSRSQDVRELTRAQVKELERRVKDARDPTRYLIISRLLKGSRFVLYYNVSNDAYTMDNPEGGTLFKRRKAAELIHKSLGRGNEVVEVKVVGGKVRGAPTRSRRGARALPTDR
jgi:hypothetical protein